jgi:hypothetical protein
MKKPLLNRATAKRNLLITAGFACLLLGALGIFIPVLPTTPFLLLAARLFMRSSSRLYLWITHHRIFGTFIRNYRRFHAVPLRSKVIALVLLWLTIGYSLIWVAQAWCLRALLFLVAAGVSVHILRMKTLTPSMLVEIAALEPILPTNEVRLPTEFDPVDPRIRGLVEFAEETLVSLAAPYARESTPTKPPRR